jgi:hypothetical protein
MYADNIIGDFASLPGSAAGCIEDLDGKTIENMGLRSNSESFLDSAILSNRS